MFCPMHYGFLARSQEEEMRRAAEERARREEEEARKWMSQIKVEEQGEGECGRWQGWWGPQQPGDHRHGGLCGRMGSVPPTARFGPALPSIPSPVVHMPSTSLVPCSCLLPGAVRPLYPCPAEDDKAGSLVRYLCPALLPQHVSLVLWPVPVVPLAQEGDETGARHATHARPAPCTPTPTMYVPARVPPCPAEGDETGAAGESLLAALEAHVKGAKIVGLEALALEFGLRTADAIERIRALEAMGRLTGVMDERGKVGVPPPWPRGCNGGCLAGCVLEVG